VDELARTNSITPIEMFIRLIRESDAANTEPASSASP